MDFVKSVFYWSGIYGIVVLVPLLFLEEKIGHVFPPLSNHPEQYYGFMSVALAWQLVFLIIARNPVKYHLLMLPAIVEKLLPSGITIFLFFVGRIDLQQ